MKQDWKTTTIQDACEQMNGIWKGVKPPFTTAKILRTTNFSKDCKIKLDDLAIIEVEEKKMNARRLKRGDIIVEKSGGGPKQPVGRVILFDIDDEDFSFCNFTSALRVKNQSEILPEYLHKYLTFLYFEGETEKYQSNLVGFRNLDFKGYVSMSFRYPELSEQPPEPPAGAGRRAAKAPEARHPRGGRLCGSAAQPRRRNGGADRPRRDPAPRA